MMRRRHVYFYREKDKKKPKKNLVLNLSRRRERKNISKLKAESVGAAKMKVPRHAVTH
jgi:hypothetical protein